MCASRARQTRLCICDLAREKTVDMTVEYDVHDKINLQQNSLAHDKKSQLPVLLP